MSSESTTKFRFKNLDSIRTIAFLSTFMAHAFYAVTPSVLNSDAYHWATKFREVFSFGVPIFFVLSGFLISYLMLREQSLNGRFSLKDFYMRRVLRIWPVFYLIVIIGFVLFPIAKDFLNEPANETANWEMYVSFLSNFDQLNVNALPIGIGLGPTWSVSVEEQFYLFWPLLFLIFRGKKFIYGIGITLIAAIVCVIAFSLPPKHTVYCMVYLSIGGLYAYLAYYHEKLIQRITQVNGLVFIAASVVLIAFMYVSTIGYSGAGMLLLIALNIGYIIIYQCYSDNLNLNKLPFLERWGKYTYGLYLYHTVSNFVIYKSFTAVLNFQETTFRVIFLYPFCSLLLSLVFSYFSYRYFERFFLNLKKRFSPVKE